MRISGLSVSFLLLACAVSTVVTCTPKTSTEEGSADNNELVPVSVTTALTTRKTLYPKISMVGLLVSDPRQTATVTSRVIGHVQEVHVTTGDHVSFSDPIVSLDPTLATLLRDAAKAALAEAEADYLRLKNGTRPERIQVASREVDSAAAIVTSRRIRLEAAKKLLSKNDISKVKVAELTASVSMADANLATARARLTLLRAGTRSEAIAAAKARWSRNKAILSQTQTKLDWMQIKASFESTVVSVLVRPDADVTPSMVLAKLVDLTTILAEVRLPAGSVLRIPDGAAATVEINGLESLGVNGKFDRTVGSADPMTGSIVAWIRVPNRNRRLRPGLACRIHLSLREIPDAICVPIAAISDRLGEAVVTVVRGNKAFEVAVHTGIRVGLDVQILDGIVPGDIVVTSGGYGLPDGCPVLPTN